MHVSKTAILVGTVYRILLVVRQGTVSSATGHHIYKAIKSKKKDIIVSLNDIAKVVVDQSTNNT